MNVLVIGASRGIGLAIAKQAVDRFEDAVKAV